ncbi:MAG: GNAT family N-acetyltransferase [Myxococcus sp.]|nr:GNAT family N-acetyltransferase [Myxococcus sp.]
MSPPNPPQSSEKPPPNTADGFLAVPLLPSHPTRDFDSGEPELDEFLRRYALKNEGTVSRTFVMLDEGQPRILGFYTLAVASATPAEVGPHHPKRLPNYQQLGAVLIARLGRHISAKGAGLGRALIFDALKRCRQVGVLAGCAGVLVDAKHERAAGFYERYGFARLGSSGERRRLYLPLATIERLLHG